MAELDIADIGDPTDDGAAAARRRIHAQRRRSVRLLLGLSLVTLFPLLLLASAAPVVVAASESGFFKDIFDRVFAGASKEVRWLLAISTPLVLTLLWHFVGLRATVAAEAVLSGEGERGRTRWRAFGPLGVMAILVGLTASSLLTWRRAAVLADKSAKAAQDAALEAAESPTGAPLDPDQATAVYTEAYDAAFWPDVAVTAALLSLLAAAGIVSAIAGHRLMQVLGLRMGERRLAGMHKRLARLHGATVEAERELADRLRHQERNAALMADHESTLPDKYHMAAAAFRQRVAELLGAPESTEILTCPDVDTVKRP